jgi:thiol-disulfide isomerase/thioredoxin
MRQSFVRLILVILLIALLPGIVPQAAAQDPDTIEALALRVHTQNVRVSNYTFWIGGNLGDGSAAPPESVLGDVIDDWYLKGLNGDPDFESGPFDRPVLLNFWASWCGPCQLEFPHLTRVALAPDEHQFDVVFVNSSDTQEDAQRFLADQPDEIYTVIDAQDQLGIQYMVAALPTSILLDADGTVLAIHVGVMTPTVSEFLDAVAANPGVGTFDAADHPDVDTSAVMAPIDTTLPIVPNEPQTGTLDNETFQQAYSFEGHTGDEVRISMEADHSDLDTYLVLIGPDGERISENDDYNGTDSFLAETLSADGTYIIVATRFLEAEGFDGGAYRLNLDMTTAPVVTPTVAPPATVTAIPTVTPIIFGIPTLTPSVTPTVTATPATTPEPVVPGAIAYGDTVSGTLDDTHYEDRWLFQGGQGDIIDATMTRVVDEMGGLDGYMQLLGPDGTVLQDVDDVGESVMPSITQYTLPADGIYTLVTTRFGFENGFSTGDYTLTLTGISATPNSTTTTENSVAPSSIRWFEPPNLPPAPRRITYGHRANGSISASDYDDWFTFTGKQASQVTIRMESDTLDTYLILMNSSGYEIAHGDDSPDSTNAEIQVDLPADDLYYIRATRYGFENGPSSGSYTLVVESDSPVIAAPGGEALPLAYNQPVGGTLDSGNASAEYTFQGSLGDVVTISARVMAGEADLGLSLRGPDGLEIVYSQGWDDPNEARIARFRLPASGSYWLDVMLESVSDTNADYQLIALSEQEPILTAIEVVPQVDMAMEVVLLWDGTADLDLRTAGITGQPAGELTASANDFCALTSAAQPTEQAIWETAQPGLYEIQIRYQYNCNGQEDPVLFTLAIIQHGEIVNVIQSELVLPGDHYSTVIEYR